VKSRENKSPDNSFDCVPEAIGSEVLPEFLSPFAGVVELDRLAEWRGAPWIVAVCGVVVLDG
jgi:hypothetical protein